VIRRIAVALVLLFAACSDERPVAFPTPTGLEPGDVPPKFRSAVADLSEVGGSRVVGRAKVVRLTDDINRFTIELTDRPTERHAAHIHSGDCSALGSITLPLSDVNDGFSQTDARRAIRGLVSGGFAVTLHTTADPNSQHIACGELVESLER
jgi:hypothetical protein